MMDIQAQVQSLIDEAPEDPELREGVQVVANVLSQVAAGLSHLQYYVLQSLEQHWQITTLEHRTQPELQKNVLYAYGYLANAMKVGQSADLMASPVLTLRLLFQFFSFDQVDSILFVEDQNQPDQFKELSRADLQAIVQQSLQDQIQPHSSGDDSTLIA